MRVRALFVFLIQDRSELREPKTRRSRLCGTEVDEARGGCLGAGWRRRTRQPAISLGELDVSFDPGISEWGNPARYMRATRSRIHRRREATQGTETSKYLEEKKERSIP
jgi:hypothetical protein